MLENGLEMKTALTHRNSLNQLFLSLKIWSKTDSQIHGRCFTTVPTIDHIQLGIQEIHLVVSSEIYLYFHTPGMFLTTKPNTEILQVHYAKMVSESSKTYEFEVKHDLFNMLSHQGELCLPI